MRPLGELCADEARRIDRVVFDLDDTVLDHGRLSEAAYSALFRMKEGGLELVASTGRSAAWAEVVARQWPVTAALAENGAVAWTRRPEGRVVLADPVSESLRLERRSGLDRLTAEILRRFDALHLADDNAGRRTDVTFDIGEHHHVEPDVIAAAREVARARGARTLVSSVHLHVTFDGHDKASGFVRWAASRGIDPTRALARAAFIGDSANDGAAFAAFGLPLGVANVSPHLAKLTIPPRFVASLPMGAGFAEIARTILRLRSDPVAAARHRETR